MNTELLAPAGDFATALAAFEAGADAVYCGLSFFSARAFATNFTLEDLRNLMRVARKRGKAVYVTFNTLIDEDDIEDAVRQLADLADARPTALIVQDLGVARLCREYFPELPLHASTQLVAHNLEGVLALKELGFSRVVLARELSLDEIASITKRCGVEVECFIHGALCYSISGLCLYSAMEKERSGNRGRCAYCCRLAHDDGRGGKTLPFSMKDMRLGEDVRKLVQAGVASLKIEGRMKSPLYVASVTKYYRDILGPAAEGLRRVTLADLETVFSRRTTELYFNGRGAESPIDPVSLGHLGTPIGTVKRVTKDREGNSWLRFHTSRALEKHDGLQFSAGDGEKPAGLGITMMRGAISRTPLFEVAAGADVEVLLPPGEDAIAVNPGDTVYCSMSNAVKRAFPIPSFRPCDYEGERAIDVEVALEKTAVTARATAPAEVAASIEFAADAARDPSKTAEGVRKAFAKLGGTDYRLGKLTVTDPEGLFVPMSVLNDLRRALVERLDDALAAGRRERLERALADDASPAIDAPSATDERGKSAATDANAERGESAAIKRVIKLRPDQRLPAGDWDEIIFAVNAGTDAAALLPPDAKVRLALPVYTAEPEFSRLRGAVKKLIRAGYGNWEASDLATLRMLKLLGVSDITADWTLYAFNASALKALASLGVRRFVASPENDRENTAFLAESGYAVEFIIQQSTPLFVSLTEPAAKNLEGLAIYRRDGLWVTTKPLPRVFAAPAAAPTRVDLSWDCGVEKCGEK